MFRVEREYGASRGLCVSFVAIELLLNGRGSQNMILFRDAYAQFRVGVLYTVDKLT